MVQRPEWRQRAAEAGVASPLVSMLHPGMLSANPLPGGTLSAEQQAMLGSNLVVQTLLTINWCGALSNRCA